jgi:hypothetical protein
MTVQVFADVIPIPRPIDVISRDASLHNRRARIGTYLSDEFSVLKFRKYFLSSVLAPTLCAIFHHALVKRKYHLLHGSQRARRPDST